MAGLYFCLCLRHRVLFLDVFGGGEKMFNFVHLTRFSSHQTLDFPKKENKCNEKFKDISFVSKDTSSYEEKEIEVVFVQFQKDKVVRNSGAYQLLLNFCY